MILTRPFLLIAAVASLGCDGREPLRSAEASTPDSVTRVEAARRASGLHRARSARLYHRQHSSGRRGDSPVPGDRFRNEPPRSAAARPAARRSSQRSFARSSGTTRRDSSGSSSIAASSDISSIRRRLTRHRRIDNRRSSCGCRGLPALTRPDVTSHVAIRRQTRAVRRLHVRGLCDRTKARTRCGRDASLSSRPRGRRHGAAPHVRRDRRARRPLQVPFVDQRTLIRAFLRLACASRPCAT